MNWKDYLKGFGSALIVLMTIGAVIATIVPQGTVINVPTGRNAFYVFIPSDYNDEVLAAAKYWDGMNDTKTVLEGYTDLNAQGTLCIKEWINIGHKLYDEEIFKRSQINTNAVE
jgi:hypothetical protein